MEFYLSAEIIQSVAVPSGKMIAGMAKGIISWVLDQPQKIDYSDQYKFLEDERTYMAKQYANGKPQDNESFLLFDITGLEVPVV